MRGGPCFRILKSTKTTKIHPPSSPSSLHPPSLHPHGFKSGFTAQGFNASKSFSKLTFRWSSKCIPGSHGQFHFGDACHGFFMHQLWMVPRRMEEWKDDKRGGALKASLLGGGLDYCRLTARWSLLPCLLFKNIRRRLLLLQKIERQAVRGPVIPGSGLLEKLFSFDCSI